MSIGSLISGLPDSGSSSDHISGLACLSRPLLPIHERDLRSLGVTQIVLFHELARGLGAHSHIGIHAL